ncbi:hypothetical protein Taro_038514, partial [Colocasia esculenta]|nr:hypothetical protein [Colocasia esculenta]
AKFSSRLRKEQSEKLRGKVRAFAPFRARRGGGSCPLPLRLRPQLTPSVRSGVSPQHRLQLAAEDSSPSLLSPSPASRRRKRVPFCSGSSQVLFFPSSPLSPAREPLLEASAADSTHGVSSLDDVCWLSSVWFRLYLRRARSPHPLPVICCNLSLFDPTLASSPRDRLDCRGFAYPCRSSADVRRRLPQAALCAVRWLQRFPFIGAPVLLPRLVLLLCFRWWPLELPSMWSSSFVLVGWGFAPLCEGLRSSGCNVGWFPFAGVRRFLLVEGNLIFPMLASCNHSWEPPNLQVFHLEQLVHCVLFLLPTYLSTLVSVALSGPLRDFMLKGISICKPRVEHTMLMPHT